jgi:hypothetical protein
VIVAGLVAGSWTELIGGLATAGALVFTALTFRNELEERREARLEQTAAREERERAQADCVGAWFTADMTSTSPPRWEIGMLARNASPSPVYGVEMTVAWRWDVIDSSAPSGLTTRKWGRDVLGPGETWTMLDAPVPQAKREGLGRPQIGIKFTDASGRRWYRSHGGLLERIAESTSDGGD